MSDTGNGKIKKYSSTGTWLLTIGATNTYHGNDLSGTSAYLSIPNMVGIGINNPWLSSNEYTVEDAVGNFYFMDGNVVVPGGQCAGKQLRKYSSTGAFLMRIGNWAARGSQNMLGGTSANFQNW